MNEFLSIISSYPTAIPTVVLGVLMVFWLLAILGAVDHEHFGPDWLGHHDHDIATDHAPESLLAMGFANLPFSVVVSAIGFFWWAFCLLAQVWLAPLVPLPTWLEGTVFLLATLFLSVPAAGLAVRPLRPIFAQRGLSAVAPKIIGMPCKITTLTVDEKFGQAEVQVEQGAPLMIKVWAQVPNTLSRGHTALVLSFDTQSQRYEVEPYQP